MPRPWSIDLRGERPRLTHANQTIKFISKDGSEEQLHDFCSRIIPPCNLNSALFNGHAQTAWTVVSPEGPAIYYKRRTFAAEDLTYQGHFAVDFVSCPPGLLRRFEDNDITEDPTRVGHTYLPPRTTYLTQHAFNALKSQDDKPVVIVLHGLSGGSYEAYVRYALAPLVVTTGESKGISGGDWEALVVNSRGCAGSRVTSRLLYHARSTWDIRQVVKWARRTWSNRPLYAMGFSIGANILTNYIAEEGSNCILKAAVVVSNPWDLEACHQALQRSYLGMEVYSTTMGASMRSVFDTHKDQILSQNQDIDAERIKSGKYLFEFDRDLQCPLWGFESHEAYYRQASSSNNIHAISIPLLALHAEDDPITGIEAVPFEEFERNPFTTFCLTCQGGHLGWFEVGGGRWYARATTAFLNGIQSSFDTWREPEKDLARDSEVSLQQ